MMTISAVSSTSPLLKQLEANGLSASKANLVQTDLAASQEAATASKTLTGLTPSTRAAFDAKISSDVLSGKLSANGAAAARKTIDDMDSGSATSSVASHDGSSVVAAEPLTGSANAGKAGGGGGGGGSSTKTEVSEVVTVSGSTMTTVVVAP